jgi:hypothetical protein
LSSDFRLGFAYIAAGMMRMVGGIKAAAFENHCNGRIDPLDMCMPGWAFYSGLTVTKG